MLRLFFTDKIILFRYYSLINYTFPLEHKLSACISDFAFYVFKTLALVMWVK